MKTLVFAPHNDDEVLGAGGTIAKYARNGDEVVVCEVTAGSLTSPRVQQIKREALCAHKILGVSRTVFLDLPVVGLKELPTREINQAFDRIVQEIQPEVVFLPHIGDMHIDHRETVEAALVALRPVGKEYIKQIYMYETLSETEWSLPSAANAFIPNMWVDITDTLSIKLEAMACYTTQLVDFPHPRSLECLEALARTRGGTICKRAAEAFQVVRIIR